MIARGQQQQTKHEMCTVVYYISFTHVRTVSNIVLYSKVHLNIERENVLEDRIEEAKGNTQKNLYMLLCAA